MDPVKPYDEAEDERIARASAEAVLADSDLDARTKSEITEAVIADLRRLREWETMQDPEVLRAAFLERDGKMRAVLGIAPRR